MPTGIWSSRWRSGCAHWDHWDLDCEEEAAGEEAEEENSSDINLTTLTWQVGKKVCIYIYIYVNKYVPIYIYIYLCVKRRRFFLWVQGTKI